jgi:hypothetical protein
MGQGLQLAGASDALWQLLAQRKAESIAAQQYADKQKQQQFQNNLHVRELDTNDALHRDELARHTQADQLADEDRKINLGRQTAEAIPIGTFLDKLDPGVGRIQAAGLGGTLSAQAPTQPMGPDFVGPMPNGETPQQAQVGRPGGFLTMGTAKQLDTQTDNTRQAESLQRQIAADASNADIRGRLADIAGQNADVRGRMADIAGENARLKNDAAAAKAAQGPKLPQREDDTVVSIHQMSPLIEELLQKTQQRIASKPKQGMLGALGKRADASSRRRRTRRGCPWRRRIANGSSWRVSSRFSARCRICAGSGTWISSVRFNSTSPIRRPRTNRSWSGCRS